MTHQAALQAKPASTPHPLSSGLLQRKCESCGQHKVGGGKCETCQQNSSFLQRKATQAQTPSEVPPIVHEVLRSPGESLDANTRDFMESRFNHDFSQVRVHTDRTSPKATESAKAVKALAYTVGQKIIFNKDQYNPHTRRGQQVLAHELAHTIQQQHEASTLQINDSASLEQQANAAAVAVVSGLSPVKIDKSISKSVTRFSDPPKVPKVPTPLNLPQDQRKPLTVEEMIDLIVRERAFTFNRGGEVREDPKGVGRGVGSLAGGKTAGSSVFTVMQVTDSQGRLIEISRGEHVPIRVDSKADKSNDLIFGTRHAEPRALQALGIRLKKIKDSVSGGTLTVAIDQYPCGGEKKDCLGGLIKFAKKYNLRLEVYVPEGGDARFRLNPDKIPDEHPKNSPRRSAMNAQRSDFNEKPHLRTKPKLIMFQPPSGDVTPSEAPPVRKVETPKSEPQSLGNQPQKPSSKTKPLASPEVKPPASKASQEFLANTGSPSTALEAPIIPAESDVESPSIRPTNASQNNKSSGKISSRASKNLASTSKAKAQDLHMEVGLGRTLKGAAGETIILFAITYVINWLASKLQKRLESELIENDIKSLQPAIDAAIDAQIASKNRFINKTLENDPLSTLFAVVTLEIEYFTTVDHFGEEVFEHSGYIGTNFRGVRLTTEKISDSTSLDNIHIFPNGEKLYSYTTTFSVPIDLPVEPLTSELLSKLEGAWSGSVAVNKNVIPISVELIPLKSGKLMGTYNYADKIGTLHGVVRGNKIGFVWQEKSLRGKGVWTLTGNTLDGEWGYGNSPQGAGRWSVTK